MPHTEDMESQNQDVTQESSPEANQSDNAAQAQARAAPEQTQEQNVPFHEHPRFRELVEQKNQYANELKQYQRQMAEMQRQMQDLRTPKQQQEDALHARLKGIDPEFGERFAKVDTSLTELQELKQWKSQMEAQQIRNEAISTIEKLHTENKVPAEWREAYNAQIELAAMRDSRIGLQDLPELYKRIHGQFSKLMESSKRADREAYVTDKKKDASIPSNPKGKAPSQKSGTEWSKDPYEARQQLVNRVKQQLKADKEV